MPTMLTWMIVIIGLLPAIMAVIGILVLNKYPINHEERQKMQAFISEHQTKKEIE